MEGCDVSSANTTSVLDDGSAPVVGCGAPSRMTTCASSPVKKARLSFEDGERPSRRISTDAMGEASRFADRLTSSRVQVSAAFKRRMDFFSSESWQVELMTDEQLARSRWLVLPESRPKIAWDWFVILLVLYKLVEIPLVLGFRLDVVPGLVAVNVFIDLVLIVDMLVSFRTCHFTTERHLLLDVKENRRAYLRSWFVPDLISTVPFHLVVPGDLGRTMDAFAKFLRIARIVRLIKMANHIAYARLLRIILLVSFLVLWTHWLACAQYALSNVPVDHVDDGMSGALLDDASGGDSDGGDAGGGTGLSEVTGVGPAPYVVGARGVSWVERLGLHHQSFSMRYLAAYYYAVTMSAKSPWLAPSPPGEFLFGCVAVVVCSVLYAAFVGSFTAVFTSYDAHLGRQREALNLVRVFSRYRGLSQATQTRLVKNYEAYWHESNGIDTQKFLRTMVPRHLLQDVLKELYAPVLFTMPSLTNNDNLSADGLFAFLSGLRTQVLLSGDVLWRGGQYHTTVYILMHGSVQLLVARPGCAEPPSQPPPVAAARTPPSRPSSRPPTTSASPDKNAAPPPMRGARKQSVATSFRTVAKRLSETHAALYKVERPGSLLGFQHIHRPVEPMPFGARADQRSTCYSIDRQQLQELIRTFDGEGTFHKILVRAAREAILKCRKLTAINASNATDGRSNTVDEVLHEWADFCSDDQPSSRTTSPQVSRHTTTPSRATAKPSSDQISQLEELADKVAILQSMMSEVLDRLPPKPAGSPAARAGVTGGPAPAFGLAA